MGNISNTLLLGEIDKVAAVVKAQKAAYSATTDTYALAVREQNPDDLADGVEVLTTLDTAFEDGTNLHNQFSGFLGWIGGRAVDAGSENLADLLSDRYLRVPDIFNTLIYTPISGAIDGANTFPDTDVSFGTFAYGGSFAAGSDLASTVDYCWGVIEVGTGGIGTPGNWVLTVTVTYADDTSDDETITCIAEATATTLYDIGRNEVTGLSAAGSATVLMSDTTGMVAGQFVILKDASYPSLLTADLTASGNTAPLTVAQAGAFNPGDTIYLHDDDTSDEEATIESINYETGAITLAADCSGTFTTAQNAFIRLKTPAGNGWQECHEIDSVSTNTSITLTGNKQHTYFTDGFAVRAIKDVTAIVTSSGGHAGDDVIARSFSERTISQ